MKSIDKLKVHYAPSKLKGDIPVKEFDFNVNDKRENDQFWHWFFVNFNREKDTMVWVVSIDEEVFVTSRFNILSKNVESMLELYLGQCEMFIQEYNSYEEAYKIALAMKEPNILCYEQE